MNVCHHWIGNDTTGHTCGTPIPTDAMYCDKHLAVVRARTEKQLAANIARAFRDDAKWRERNLHRLPGWRVSLERAETEYARRTASPIGDRAAVGGVMHSSIVRRQAAHLSDTNVARVVELERIIRTLRHDIARLGDTT